MFNCFSCCQPSSNQVPDFTVLQQKGKQDKHIIDMEKSSMFLNMFSFKAWVSQLIDFNIQNATVNYDSRKDYHISYQHDQYMSPMNEDLFQSFLENKIFKMEPFYSKFGNDESLKFIFKDILVYMHQGLCTRLRNHHKTDSDEMKAFKKCDGLAMGLLFCKGRNDDKLKYLFELFQYDNVLKASDQFNNFLISMIILSSYSLINARHKLTSKFHQFSDIQSSLKVILDAYEVKDVIRLVDFYNSQLFTKEKESYTYDEFKKEIIERNLGWILYPACIRYQLEEHNDIK